MGSDVRILTRWMQLALAAVALGLVAVGAWFYGVEKADVRQRAEQEFSAVAHSKVDQIIAWRDERMGDGAQITDGPFLAEAAASYLAAPDSAGAQRLLDRFKSLATHSHYVDVLLVGPDGRVRLSVAGGAELIQDYETSLAGALRMRKPVFTELHTDSRYPIPHMSVVAPIFHGDGPDAPPVGAVVMVCDASQYLYPLIRSWPTSSRTAETVLVRRDGDSVLFLSELRHRSGSTLTLRIPLSRTDVPAVMGVLGRRGLVEGHDYSGADTVAVVEPVPDSTWVVVSKEDAAEVFAGWSVHATELLSMLLLALGAVASVGLVAWQRDKKAHYRALYHAEAALRGSVERHSITLKSVGDGIIATDVHGRVELLNPVAETLTGYSQTEAVGRSLSEIFRIVREENLEPADDPVARVLREGLVVGLANHTLLVTKSGTHLPIADSAAPIRGDDGKLAGVVLVFRDQSEERRTHRLVRVRLDLLDYASAHTLGEILTRALDELGVLLDSPIGIYHLLEPDETTLALSQWSTRTLSELDQADDHGLRHAIDRAGIWADCVREKRPIVHNDYSSLPGGKATPGGHPAITRELFVPVIRQDRVVAILAAANKPAPYTDDDVESAAYVADVAWHIVEGKRTEERRREIDLRFRAIYDRVDVGIAEISLDHRFRRANATYCRWLGYSEQELIGKPLREVTDPRDQEANQYLHGRLTSGAIDHYGMEKRLVCKDGHVFDGLISATLVRDAVGQPAYTLGAVLDITERKRADEERNSLHAQLTQAQKMESVGRLAGGIAHDFNNMLLVILGRAEIVLDRMEPGSALHGDLLEIQKAALRSADLTRQLLAFARKQVVAPKVLDLDATVEAALKMLRRLIGEDIDLLWRPRAGQWRVRLDPAQLDQVMANLCVNARDAIHDVGRVTIETDTVTLDDAYCALHAGFVPGEFVMLAVSDDGSGMDREVQRRLFDPFFTTKAPGHGTGLGLSTVYGIVKQNDGFINVYSEPGHGSTFKIYFPRCGSAGAESANRRDADTRVGRGETVLLVEDEVPILTVATAMLRRLGYTVLPANTAREAISLCETHEGTIHLLLTDVVMGEMNGRDLAARLASIRPGLKPLFMSGFTATVIADRGVLEEGIDFIQKPFTIHDLGAKVGAALDRS
jgi:PAS domain S-box-containing protein